MCSEYILKTSGLTKTYGAGATALTVLREISFSLEPGATCAIVGPSGSGKTTLLGLCAGLDTPSSGTVVVDGCDIATLGEDGRALLRNRSIGFVFQNFQLIPTLTALENVLVPLELRGAAAADAEARALLDQVGLGERLGHYPAQLSGGEQQRVALARAFAGNPKLVFCDEPTGNLDTDTAERVVGLIFEMNRRMGTALVLVTHDIELAARTGRIIRLRSGSIVSDENLAVATAQA